MLLADALRRAAALLACCGLAGCSENLGVAPPDGGRRIPVAAEGVTGPERARTVLAVALGGDRLWVGCDGGLYAGDAGAAELSWSAVHAGFLGADGFERTASVDAVATSPDGRLVLHLGRVTPVFSLVASRDGGRTHDRLGLPDPVLTTVGEIAVLGESTIWPRGAWVVHQGTQVFVRAVGSSAWQQIELPASPSVVRRLRPAPDGRLVIVAGSEDTDRVWATSVAAPLRAQEVESAAPVVLDAMVDADTWYAAHSGGIDRQGEAFVRWPGHTVLDAGLQVQGAELRWTIVGRSSDGSEHLASGVGAAVVATSTPLEGALSGPRLATEGASAGFVLRGAPEQVVLAQVGTAPPSLRSGEARFVELDVRAVTVLDPAVGTIAVGSEFSGTVFAGPSDDPSAFVQLGIGPLSSQVTALVGDADGRVVAGSFGTHRFDPAVGRWETVNDGQFTYQPGDFGGPVVVRTLDRDVDGALWLGADNGDGVYRGTDATGAGLVWERLHEGFGAPGSFSTEFGLPLVTQARAFARDATERTWMGGFRGGAWVLDPGSSTWTGANHGLRDLAGAVYDSCCVVAGGREIDVRDLVALDDGTLLAATAWGVFAREDGAARWQERSLGLATRDAFALAAHPRRGGTVVAGVAAAAEGRGGQWLYLTEDAGRTWFPVDVTTLARDCTDLVWSRPDRMEIVALLRARGALRVELAP